MVGNGSPRASFILTDNLSGFAGGANIDDLHALEISGNEGIALSECLRVRVKPLDMAETGEGLRLWLRWTGMRSSGRASSRSFVGFI